MTIGSKVLGSAHYLSPEQARGGFTDERSDIYSLGVCMYEMVVGKVPFDADTTVAVAMQHLQKEPADPCTLVDDLPEAVGHIILRAMRKEQSQRYPSAGAMESDIMRVLADPSVTLSDSDSDAAFYSTRQIDVVDDSMIKKAEKEEKKNASWLIWLGSALAIIAAIFLIKGIFFSGSDLRVPNIKGLTIEQAYEKLSEMDGEIKIRVRKEEYGEMDEKDKIIEQDPQEGMKLPGTKEIEVVIGLGAESFENENFVGLTAQRHRKRLRIWGSSSLSRTRRTTTLTRNTKKDSSQDRASSPERKLNTTTR